MNPHAHIAGSVGLAFMETAVVHAPLLHENNSRLSQQLHRNLGERQRESHLWAEKHGKLEWRMADASEGGPSTLAETGPPPVSTDYLLQGCPALDR